MGCLGHPSEPSSTHHHCIRSVLTLRGSRPKDKPGCYRPRGSTGGRVNLGLQGCCLSLTGSLHILHHQPSQRKWKQEKQKENFHLLYQRVTLFPLPTSCSVLTTAIQRLLPSDGPTEAPRLKIFLRAR